MQTDFNFCVFCVVAFKIAKKVQAASLTSTFDFKFSYTLESCSAEAYRFVVAETGLSLFDVFLFRLKNIHKPHD